MCSFWLTTVLLIFRHSTEKLDAANRYAVQRGPDLTHAVQYGGFTLVHNLLAITNDAASSEPEDTESTGARILADDYHEDLVEDSQTSAAPAFDRPTTLLRRPNRRPNSIVDSLIKPNSIQPFILEQDGILLLFNGEIYNYRETLLEHVGINPHKSLKAYSEGDVLLELYLAIGPSFVQLLDGEFALVLVDLREEAKTSVATTIRRRPRIVVAADVFGTKPLWYSLSDRGVHVSTYRSVLEEVLSEEGGADQHGRLDAHAQQHGSTSGTSIVHAKPNEYLDCELFPVGRGGDDLPADRDNQWGARNCRSVPVREFDLRQWKRSTTDFEAAFEHAVYKRVYGPPGSHFARVFMGLSTGYDSGAIHLALGKFQRIFRDSGTTSGKNREDHGADVEDELHHAELPEERADDITHDSSAVAGRSHGWPGGSVILPNQHRRFSKTSDNFLAYVVLDGSDRSTLLQRVAFNNVHVEPILKTWRSMKNEVKSIEALSEPYAYFEENWGGRTLQQDLSAVPGISMLTRRGARDGRRVYLSGSGADELFSDYGYGGVKFFPHSAFGGDFPKKLSDKFPWPSFFLGTMRDYLMKDEIISGLHGVEGRYPFLDFEVVQELCGPDEKHVKCGNRTR